MPTRIPASEHGQVYGLIPGSHGVGGNVAVCAMGIKFAELLTGEREIRPLQHMRVIFMSTDGRESGMLGAGASAGDEMPQELISRRRDETSSCCAIAPPYANFGIVYFAYERALVFNSVSDFRTKWL